MIQSLRDIDVDSLNGVERITNAADLPPPTNGTHSLVDETVYWFDDTVTSPAALELGDTTPVLGNHGGTSVFVHTNPANGAAIQASDVPIFMRDVTALAPGGTMFDASASATTETLMESCNFTAPAGSPMASLGTVDGFRVPTWKGCNFENFADGLTLTGTMDKVFIESCPFRNVTASGARVLAFDSAVDVDIVDMANNYVKNVQSDTEVIYVDPAATIGSIFQYRGVTHDPTVTQANILTGAAAVDGVDYRVSDSFPLTNSKAFADYTLTNPATTTITTQATDKTDESAYVEVAGATTPGTLARFESNNDNQLTYIGKRDRVGELQAILSVGTGTSDVVTAAWFQNGSLVAGTPTRVQMNQQGGGIAKMMVTAGVNGGIETGDVFDVRVANLGSTTDIDVGELTAKIAT